MSWPIVYPQIVPQEWIIPNKHNIKPSHSFVNIYGVVNIPLLRNWCKRYFSFQELVWNLTNLFGIDPAVRSRLKVPLHLRYSQQQNTNEKADTHESETTPA